MTEAEAEWTNAASPDQLLWRFRRKFSNRKLRLFACACCRRAWRWMTDTRSRNAVEVAERLADGLATEGERKAAEVAANAALMDRALSGERIGPVMCAYETLGVFESRKEGTEFVRDVSLSAIYVAYHEVGATLQQEFAAVTVLLRDLVVNPFRPVEFAPEWRTTTAVLLARQMYESRDFSAMPILADALQDVGCDNADILHHCRGPGPHVRGCWVVDLVLGKE